MISHAHRPGWRTAPALEWLVAEDDRGWQAACRQPPAGPVCPAGARQGRAWLALGFLLVFGAAVGGRLWSLSQAGLAQVEGEVAAEVAAELWTAGPLIPEHMEAGQTLHVVAHLHDLPDAATVELLDLGEAWAVVRVDFPAQSGPANRQTRVYRQTMQGWVRTAPTAAYWGAPRRLETEHFVFHYYSRDAEAVTAAATKLDALYPSLYAAYFPEPSNGSKVVVQVDPEQAPGRLASHAQPEAPLVVASPAVYLAPETVSDAELLAQAVVLALGDDLVVQLLRHLGGRDVYSQEEGRYARWAPLAQGGRLWQVWAQDLPLADWREPVVRWALGPDWSHPRTVVPEFLPQLCALHRLWLPTPYVLQIPVWCTTPRLETALFQESRTRHPAPPSQLARLAPLTPNPEFADTNELYMTMAGASPHPAAVVALATVVEYAAAVYGPESIPALLDGLNQHATWESLVPAVFGISETEFEAGWHHYLAEEYGLELDWIEEVGHGAAGPAASTIR